MGIEILIAKSKLQILILQCSLRKEWKAGDPSWVMRDKLGRFFGKGDSQKQANQSLAEVVGVDIPGLAGVLDRFGIKESDVIDAVNRSLAPALPSQAPSLKDRLLEISALANDPKKQLELEWHVGIVQSEIKYGKLIDQIVQSDPGDTIPFNADLEQQIENYKKTFGAERVSWARFIPGSYLGGVIANFKGYGAAWLSMDKWDTPKETVKLYDQFMSLLKKNKSIGNKPVVTSVDLWEGRELTGEAKAVIEFNYNNKAGTKNKGSLFFKAQKAKQDLATEYAASFFAYINADTFNDVQVINPNFSGFLRASPSIVCTKKASYLDIGSLQGTDLKEVVFHEMGHAVEANKGLSTYTWNYIQDRKQSKKDMPYNYTGRKYFAIAAEGFTTVPNSEVVSTVTQMLAEPKDLRRIAEIDRDHLMFGLWALDKKGTGATQAIVSAQNKDWQSGDPEWVSRDKSGRFTAQDRAQSVMDSIRQGKNVTSKAIDKLLKDKKFRARAGLLAGMVGADMVKQVTKISPYITSKLDQIIFDSYQQIQKDYGVGKDPISQALSKVKPLANEQNLAERLEHSIAVYAALEEALDNPPEKLDWASDVFAQRVKAAIPVTIFLAINFGPKFVKELMAGKNIQEALSAALTRSATAIAVNQTLISRIENRYAKVIVRAAVNVFVADAIYDITKKWKDMDGVESLQKKAETLAFDYGEQALEVIEKLEKMEVFN